MVRVSAARAVVSAKPPLACRNGPVLLRGSTIRFILLCCKSANDAHATICPFKLPAPATDTWTPHRTLSLPPPLVIGHHRKSMPLAVSRTQAELRRAPVPSIASHPAPPVFLSALLHFSYSPTPPLPLLLCLRSPPLPPRRCSLQLSALPPRSLTASRVAFAAKSRVSAAPWVPPSRARAYRPPRRQPLAT
jgi:hypothetical protein